MFVRKCKITYAVVDNAGNVSTGGTQTSEGFIEDSQFIGYHV